VFDRNETCTYFGDRTLPLAGSMSDFFQQGLISTLHRLVPVQTRDQIEDLRADESITLVLPCHYTEIGTAALKTIISALDEGTFIGNVVISMNGIPEDRISDVKRFWSGLKLPHVVLWNDSPELLQGTRATGTACHDRQRTYLWLAFGWLTVDGTALDLPVESGWGLEIGSLCELHRLLDPVPSAKSTWQLRTITNIAR
jgi:hypothetical protein